MDVCKETEDIGEDNDPVRIFGLFRKSKKRAFTRNCIVLDIRPFEMWDRDLEKGYASRMQLFDGPEWKTTLAVLFECEDGSRIMGYIESGKLNYMAKLSVGDRCKVSGVFDYIRNLKDTGVFLFFRIKELVVC